MPDTLAERVRSNQQKLAAELKPTYDFIVCGSGSSGSVVARRLAENTAASVLLLEAGGSDEAPTSSTRLPGHCCAVANRTGRSKPDQTRG